MAEATTQTRESRRDAAETDATPVTKTLADHLRVALEGLAYHQPDMQREYVDAIGAVLLAHLRGAGIGLLWEDYVEAHDSVYDLQRGGDPFKYCDADWRDTSVESAREAAIADWGGTRDDLLDHLLALLPGHHHDPLPAKPELLESA